MLYVILKNRVRIQPNTPLKIQDIASVRTEKGEQKKEIDCCSLPFPKTQGIYPLSTHTLLKHLLPFDKNITFLGEETCYVHIKKEVNKGFFYYARLVLAFCALMVGSCFAITWFHQDVGMLDVQKDMFEFFSGKKTTNTHLIIYPYALGVGVGVAFFYALIGKKKNVSPLDIQLNKFHQDLEQTAGEQSSSS